MLVGQICSREVSFCEAGTTAERAASQMREAHVGDLVVVGVNGVGVRTPVGVITDRDLVVEVMAQQVDPAVVSVGELIVADCLCINENATVFQAIEMMQKGGVRRLPVTDGPGGLVGIVSADDLSALMAKEMLRLSQVGFRQRVHEIAARV